jgi:hypothetical protein
MCRYNNTALYLTIRLDSIAVNKALCKTSSAKGEKEEHPEVRGWCHRIAHHIRALSLLPSLGR